MFPDEVKMTETGGVRVEKSTAKIILSLLRGDADADG